MSIRFPALAERAFVSLALVAALAACGEKLSETEVKAPDPIRPSPSAVLIGQTPAPPTDRGAGTPVGATPTTSHSEVSPSVASQAMPLPGQPNDHSNLAPGDSTKAGNGPQLKSPEAAKEANSGTPR